jgi:hypothetical protein
MSQKKLARKDDLELANSNLCGLPSSINYLASKEMSRFKSHT